MVTRLASLTLAVSLLTSAGCAMSGNGSGGGWFSRWRHNNQCGDCCCDPCMTGCDSCPTGGCGSCGVVSHLPPSGPILTPPPGMVVPPPPVNGTAGLMTAPPPRIAPIPQATPTPYTP